MAVHIENKEIKALPVLPYSEVRAKLRSGDILFTSGDYLISKAIQKMTFPWFFAFQEVGFMLPDSLVADR